jgi:hypothetical protein
MSDKLSGIFRALIVDVLDPTALGRVRCKIGASEVEAWAPVVSPTPGARFELQVGDEVCVAFEAADAERPVVLGAFPTPGGAGDRSVRLVAASGASLEMDATRLSIETGDGTRVTLGPGGRVEILASSTIELKAAQAKIEAAVTDVSGALVADTLIARTGVVSPSYTPGAGNLA